MDRGTDSNPFPISFVNGQYLIFDVDIVTQLRKEHNICGVLVGTIPHISNQNVFFGLPLQLMPEETRVLVESGHAFIADDANNHQIMMSTVRPDEISRFKEILKKKGLHAAEDSRRKQDEVKLKHLNRLNKTTSSPLDGHQNGPPDNFKNDEDDLLMSSAKSEISPDAEKGTNDLEGFAITPSTSFPPLASHEQRHEYQHPETTSSYPLFKYLHSRGFFMTPGLRFGCNYCVYPSDPLRFHSHFLAVGRDFDEEFGLLDIVGGGRLGTSVKKSYLIGGECPNERQDPSVSADPIKHSLMAAECQIRTFSIEWAGM